MNPTPSFLASLLVGLIVFTSSARALIRGECPDNGQEFYYEYQRCDQGKFVVQVSGSCLSNGTLTETEVVQADCTTDWVQVPPGNDGPIAHCLECENTAVCADSSDANYVCPQVLTDTCKSGLGSTYAVYRQECVNGNDFRYSKHVCSEGNLASQLLGGVFDCVNLGYGSRCLNCDGLALCADSSCGATVQFNERNPDRGQNLNGKQSEQPTGRQSGRPKKGNGSTSAASGLWDSTILWKASLFLLAWLSFSAVAMI